MSLRVPPPKSIVENRKPLPTPTATSNNDEAITRAKPPAPKKTIGKIGGRKATPASAQPPVSDDVQPVFNSDKGTAQKAKVGSVGGVKKTIGKIGEKKGSGEAELGRASPIATVGPSTAAATMVSKLCMHTTQCPELMWARCRSCRLQHTYRDCNRKNPRSDLQSLIRRMRMKKRTGRGVYWKRSWKLRRSNPRRKSESFKQHEIPTNASIFRDFHASYGPRWFW